MAILQAGGTEQGNVYQALSAQGTGAAANVFIPPIRFNATISGTFVGSIGLEKSFDGGTTFIPVTVGGQALIFTAPGSELMEEAEPGMRYRWNASLSSGTYNSRLSASRG